MVYPSQTRREFPKALIFITTEGSVRFNFFAMVAADTFPRSRSRMTNSLGVHARWSVCISGRAAALAALCITGENP